MPGIVINPTGHWSGFIEPFMPFNSPTVIVSFFFFRMGFTPPAEPT